MVKKASKILNSSKLLNSNTLQQRRNVPKKLKLTNSEKEVLHLLHIECLTPVEIAKRRKVSKSAVSQIIKKLKEKGFFNASLKSLTHGGVASTSLSKEHPFRLHGQRFYIEILDRTKA